MPLPAIHLLNAKGEEFVTHGTPRALITGTGADPRPRLRVDPGQTGFFEGREFRSYLEFSIASGATLVGRFISPVDYILFKQAIQLSSGAIRLAAITGGTPGGTWTSVPVIGKNRMSDRPLPLYNPQVTLSRGGTSTGGTEVDVVIISAVQSGQNANTVGDSDDDQRGLPAGEYHLRFQNTSAETANGLYALAWEERQPSSTTI